MKAVKNNPQLVLEKLKKLWDDEGKVLKCTLPFQRQAGVWNALAKSNLVWSVISGSYIPPIVLLRDKSGVSERGKDTYIYEIVDGQQRLTNMFSYMNDEWVLHKDTPPVKCDGFTFDIAGRKFSELEEELRNAINQYKFILQCFEDYTLEEVEELFYRINSGVALSAVQKSKAKMGTDMTMYFTELLGGTFFSNAVHVTDAQAKREERLLMLLQSVLLLDNRQDGYEYKSISAAFCEKYAEELRGNYGEDHRTVLSETVAYLNKAFKNANKFLRKNNVPIVVVMAKVALEQKIEPHDFRMFINEFSNAFYSSYEMGSGSGNVKARQVQMRLRVMFLAFCKYFNLNAENVGSPFASSISIYDGILPEDELLPDEFFTDPQESDTESGADEANDLVVPEGLADTENPQPEEEFPSSDGIGTDGDENSQAEGEIYAAS